ncbi:MAG TPA: PEP-CTERM sorting domain-containing protein [Lacipirellulaceae bacterium]
MKRSAMLLVATLVIVSLMSCEVWAQPVVVTWDGGNGYFQDAKWNGGQTATAVFGDNRMSNGVYDVTIGGGSQVTFLADNADNPDPNRTASGIRPRALFADPVLTEGSFTVKDGATFTHTTGPFGDADGMWTQWDTDLVLDNGTFKRNFVAGTAEAGGVIMFGSWRSYQNQSVDMLVTNGGKFENDGQVWFGADNEHAVGLKVNWDIDGGTVDLTGGDLHEVANDNYLGPGWGDTYANLAFFYGIQLTEGHGINNSTDPKGEQYEVNFSGYTGSLIVDTINAPAPTTYLDGKPGNPHGSGIRIYRTDSAGTTTETQASFEDLWNEGILKRKGITGGYYDSGALIPTNDSFANYFTVTGDPNSDNYTVSPKALTTVTWDGGTGEWNDDAKWNGGQTAQTVLGRTNGNGGGFAIVIDGSAAGGANVSYDGNAGTGTNSDFRLEPNSGISSLTIQNGGMLTLNSADDIDGVWTRMGGDLTIDGAGSKFVRSKSDPSVSGGVLLLGAFSQKFGQEIDVNITNGGLLDNEGELYWGGDGGENSAGLSVTITIDGGTMNLHGGDEGELGNGANGLEEAFSAFGFNVEPTMLFTRTPRAVADQDGPAGDANEQYVINFTGGGSITVDSGGIYEAEIDEATLTVNSVTPKTYEALWADGILQANGESGLTGANFNTFFSVTGTHLSDGYTLTSLFGALDGDFNNDGKVDAADYVVWRKTDGSQPGYDEWRTNFGRTAGSGSALGSAAVPEPSALVLLAAAIAAFGCVRRR